MSLCNPVIEDAGFLCRSLSWVLNSSKICHFIYLPVFNLPSRITSRGYSPKHRVQPDRQLRHAHHQSPEPFRWTWQEFRMRRHPLAQSCQCLFGYSGERALTDFVRFRQHHLIGHGRRSKSSIIARSLVSIRAGCQSTKTRRKFGRPRKYCSAACSMPQFCFCFARIAVARQIDQPGRTFKTLCLKTGCQHEKFSSCVRPGVFEVRASAFWPVMALSRRFADIGAAGKCHFRPVRRW